MPRNPAAGLVSAIFGLAWAAIGLVLGAWAATTALDVAKGFELALWALRNVPIELPWDPVDAANYAINHVVPVAAAALVALLFAGSNLRTARIAFRPASESQDGKGALQLRSIEQPRVGRALEGAIRLRDAPVPGEEFDVVLTGGKGGGASGHRFEQRVRARQGAHGVDLPFRFEVPALAPPSGHAYRWRLEFAPAGRTFRRSWFDVKLGPAPERELRAPETEAHAPMAGDSPALASASAQAQGYVERIEKLYGTFGGKLSDAQRAQLRAKLSSPAAHGLKQPLEAFGKLTPQHVKLIKYAIIGMILVFFVLPFVLSLLGVILAAIFGQ